MDNRQILGPNAISTIASVGGLLKLFMPRANLSRSLIERGRLNPSKTMLIMPHHSHSQTATYSLS
jgi:hypothetical protein